MSLFKRNPNESAYTGGKKHFVDIIKNNGPENLLVWRQPEEDFNTNSTLIVMPGEEAIFLKDGRIIQTFTNGKHRLTTDNYPFIGRIRNNFSGGVSEFNCVVYFVRSAPTPEIAWGTSSPIQVRDKKLNVATEIRGRGAYKAKISNPSLFLEKLMGNNVLLQYPEELNKYFISEFQSKIVTSISRALQTWDGEILGISAYLDVLADRIKPLFQETLTEYGLTCVNFVISNLDIVEDELRKRYDEIHMETTENAMVEYELRRRLGDTEYERVKSAQYMENLTRNGGMMGPGMGFGAGNIAAEVTKHMYSSDNSQRSDAGDDDDLPERRFVQKSAVSTSSVSAKSLKERLIELQEALECGLIGQEEYDECKRSILSDWRGGNNQ